jgi:hypothetical protein
MKLEIPFQEGRVIFFKEVNFWDNLLENCNNTKFVYIATYNFNFNQYEKSFYKKLAELANRGVEVYLLYSKMTYAKEDKLEIDEIFENFVLCAHLEGNHSKLFITEEFAFIGSANFSFGSNDNYESGVIFTNKEIIKEIRKYYGEELLENSEFTNVPETFDPFDFLPGILHRMEELSMLETKEDLYNSDMKFAIVDLRFVDELEKHLEKLGYPVPAHFNWWELYMLLYEEKSISDHMFHDFKKYLKELVPYLVKVTSYIKDQYETVGRVELLKRIKVIK